MPCIMKWGNFPGKSSVHRYTCLALYRALLRQCPRLPSTISGNYARKVLREKFYKCKGLNSPTKTLHSLEAGYEALDMMHSASQGDKFSMQRICKILEDIKTREDHQKTGAKATIPTRLSSLQKKRAQNVALQRQTTFRHPDAEPILSRPRPVVTGRRRVPVFVNARGLPFLRIKKPQPQNLSRVLRQKQKFKEKLTARRHRLYSNFLFSKDEEDWDRLLAGKNPTNLLKRNWIEGSWAQIAWDSHEKSLADNMTFQQKQVELAEAMWKVVLAERKLAEKEEVEREKK